MNSDPSTAHFDPAPLHRLTADLGSAFVAKIRGEFRLDLQTRTDQLMAAMDQGDRGMVKRQAHALKSSTATLGMMKTANLAATLERLSPAEDLGILNGLAVQFVAVSLREYQQAIELKLG